MCIRDRVAHLPRRAPVLTEENIAHSGLAHLWKVDAMLGISAALMAFSVAQAALPMPPAHARPMTYAIAPARAPGPAPEPAVLIAWPGDRLAVWPPPAALG